MHFVTACCLVLLSTYLPKNFCLPNTATSESPYPELGRGQANVKRNGNYIEGIEVTTLPYIVQADLMGEFDQLEEMDDGGYSYIGVIPIPVYLFFVYFIFIAGILGNASLFALMHHESLHTTSYSVSLRLMALTDSLYLISIFTEDVLDHQLKALYTTLYGQGELLCRVWSFILYFPSLISPWLMVAFTFDRYLAVVFPFVKQLVSAVKLALVICISLLVTSAIETLVISLSVVYGAEKETTDRCLPLPGGVIDSYLYVRSMVQESTVPCFMILYFNAHVVVAIRKSSKFRQSAKSGKEAENSQREQRVTFSLMAISTMGFIALTPMAIFLVVEGLTNSRVDSLEQLASNDTKRRALADLYGHETRMEAVWPFLNLLKLLNFGQNFYVMMATSTRYRRLFFSKLPFRHADAKSKGRADSGTTNVSG